MTDAWTDRLSDYLDGDLDHRDREALDAHLPGCAACTETLAALGTVVARARRLSERSPATDLWPGIAARLESTRGPLRLRTPRFGGWRVSFTVLQLAAAALALVLLSSGTMWLALRRHAAAPTIGTTPTTGTAPATTSPAGPDGAVADFGFARYDAAVADLERVLAQHRSELDPATVRVIEDNLRIIDRATAEARKALAADPANPYLNGHLADQMRRKVELLRQATALIHA